MALAFIQGYVKGCRSFVTNLAILSLILWALLSAKFPVITKVSDDVNNIPQQENLRCPTAPPVFVATDKTQHLDKYEMEKKLTDEVRVLCWVLTSPENVQKKAIHVKNTWGKRCNKLLFFSSANDTVLPAIGLNVTEGYQYLWGKTKQAFKTIYEKYLEEADFFLKADDDTYVVLENLRFMLKDYDPNYPVYFGCKFKLQPFVTQGYMSGGSGYILSKAAVKAFVEKALVGDPTKCKINEDTGAEDLEMGRCLETVGVEAGDSRDNFGKYRFLPFPPETFFEQGEIPNWYLQYIYYPQTQGTECCSHSAISFHYIKPNEMYALDFLIYHLRPFGVNPQDHENSLKIFQPSSTPSTTTFSESSQPQELIMSNHPSNKTNNTIPS